jgi:hypothetical protein
MQKTVTGLALVLFLVGCGAGTAGKSPETGGSSGASGYGGPPGEAAPAAHSESAASAPALAGAAAGAAPAPRTPAGAAGAAPMAPAKGDASKAPATPARAAAVDASKDSAPLATAGPMEPEAPRERALPRAGQLTAGVWDDNANFDFWKPYATGFTRARGTDFAMFAEQEMITSRDTANAGGAPHKDVDIQLVLDTTGSMGDELAYLQSEFDAIAAKLRGRFPNVTPRWSLVLYRDKGDAYVTRPFAFTTDTTKFRKDLRAQSAGGGGDMPEAVVEGLSEGLRQSWRTQDDVAKIAFWVADAPAHPGEGRQLANVIRDAKKKGVHIYPIASSDADDAAEYQMRSAAQMTGGRYMFLTNDSGVGNDHAEPHIPCYNVTKLDDAIVRMIETEITGRRAEAAQASVVRAVGRPNKEGKCQLSSGMLVASY